MHSPSLTPRQRKGFVFLNLPPELWTWICEMVVLETKPIRCFSKLGWKVNEATVKQPGISRTCHLLRNHTLGMFYEQNTFMVYSQMAMPHQVACWLSAIGEGNRARLRRLYLWNGDISEIEKYFANAGISGHVWRERAEPKTGMHVRQLVLPHVDADEDEERLKKDIDLLRGPRFERLSIE